jgi:hypothetical protein
VTSDTFNRAVAGFVGAVLLPVAFAAGPAPQGSELHPGVPAEVFVAPGRATTILFQSEQRVAAISLASPVVTYKYDRSLNQLELTPAGRSAGVETNVNLRIGPNVYILVVRVVNDVRAQYFRRFALEGDPGKDAEATLGQARPLKPAEVDIVGAAKAMERAESDPVFARANPALRIEALTSCASWNGCLVGLSAVAQFLDQDLLLFRVQWLNRTGDGLFLDPRQYVLLAAGHRIPVLSRYKGGPAPSSTPGSSRQYTSPFRAIASAGTTTGGSIFLQMRPPLRGC